MFLALRDLRFAKGRFALMGVVVALITLLLVMLSGLSAGLGDQSTSAIDRLGETGDNTAVDRIVFGAAEGGEPTASFTESQVSAEQVRRWDDQPGVLRAEPLGIGQSRLQGVPGGGGTAGTANVAVFGVDGGSPLSPLPVREGAVVIGETVAEDLGLDVGDRASVGGLDLTVGGIVADRWYSHTSVVWTALPTWASLSHVGVSGQVGTVAAVTYDDGVSAGAANGTSNGGAVDVDTADRAAGTVSATRTGSFQALGSYKSENGSLLMMQGFLYGISALVIVAFLTVWTVQRTRDIAVLKALGASGGYVLRDAMTQAAVVLLAGAGVGGAIGVAGGILAARAAPFLVTPSTTLLPVAGIVALGLVGAALAVRRVTKVDALIALGGN